MQEGLLLYSLQLRETVTYMVRSTLPHLYLWTGIRLILGVPALVRNFDPLTRYF